MTTDNQETRDDTSTPGVRPKDAQWWLAQWRREQGIEAKVQEWLDGPFSKAVEKTARAGGRQVDLEVEGTLGFVEAINDRLNADGWGVTYWTTNVGTPETKAFMSVEWQRVLSYIK